MDQRTNGPTKRGVESRSTRLKNKKTQKQTSNSSNQRKTCISSIILCFVLVATPVHRQGEEKQRQWENKKKQKILSSLQRERSS